MPGGTGYGECFTGKQKARQNPRGAMRLMGLLAHAAPKSLRMSHSFIDSLPGLCNSVGRLSLQACGLSAFIRSPYFIARLSLDTSKIAWLFERSPVPMSREKWNLPRRILISGTDVWKSDEDEVVAELQARDR
jgi:hypothetical protein